METFLNERGLMLSREKTRITHINEGFDFLGVNIRKYNGKYISKPAKDNVKKFLNNLRETVKSNRTAKTENVIRQLNPKITGWANYHRHNCAKETFGKASHYIFEMLWRWAKRRHPNKSRRWIRHKYFRTKANRHWVFSAKIKNSEGKTSYLDLVEISRTPIQRHIKIKAEATPYDPSYQKYFTRRKQLRKDKQLFRSCKSSWSAWWEIKS